MHLPIATLPTHSIRSKQAAVGLLALLAGLLWLPEGRSLWASWSSDVSLSHGPLVPVIVGSLLWAKRDRLRSWKAANGLGLFGVGFACLLYLLGVWADIDFLKPLALIGIVIGCVWFLGGNETLRAGVGPLGFLVFMIPWPTTVIDRLAFPLQLASSAYAALFAGILGAPIHREGVQLYVMPNPDAKPIYGIVVAQQCSGLTSLLVLLALGYLIAYLTPVRLLWRALMVAVVVPIALLTNATRLTVILMLGASGRPALAGWVHDHEGPVLIFICSFGLMGIRSLIMARQTTASDLEGTDVVSLPISDSELNSSADTSG
jgi:exosortase